MSNATVDNTADAINHDGAGRPDEPTEVVGRWELTRLSDDSWRICDLTCRKNDVECLVAHVTRDPFAMLDVLWLRHPSPTSHRFDNFAALLAALDAVTPDAS